jgi:hypothetical protein
MSYLFGHICYYDAGGGSASGSEGVGGGGGFDGGGGFSDSSGIAGIDVGTDAGMGGAAPDVSGLSTSALDAMASYWTGEHSLGPHPNDPYGSMVVDPMQIQAMLTWPNKCGVGPGGDRWKPVAALAYGTTGGPARADGGYLGAASMQYASTEGAQQHMANPNMPAPTPYTPPSYSNQTQVYNPDEIFNSFTSAQQKQIMGIDLTTLGYNPSL